MIEEDSFLELLANMLAADKKEVGRLDQQNRLSRRIRFFQRASRKSASCPLRDSCNFLRLVGRICVKLLQMF